MDYFQKISKPELTTTIVDIAAQYFGIENGEEKCDLQSFFDFYAGVKMKEKVVNTFSNLSEKQDHYDK